MTQPSTWTRSANFALLAVLLAGCQPSSSQEPRKTPEEKQAEEYVVPKPTAKQLLESTAPGYVTPAGTQQECLGRLVFDVAGPMEWPDQGGGGIMSFLGSHRFSENVSDGQDALRIGNVTLGLLKPDKAASLAAIAESSENTKRAHIESQLSRIARLERTIVDNKSRLETGEYDDADDRQGLERSLPRLQREIEEAHTGVKKVQEHWQPLNLGMPDSIAFWDTLSRGVPTSGPHSDDANFFYAYILRNGHLYAFHSGSQADKATHQKEFLAFLKRWRPRAMGEIPKELGVCVPYGFVADDGKSIIHTRMSLRYLDAPGVLYTIQNSNVNPRLGPEATVVTAAGRALAGIAGTYEESLVKQNKITRLGPQIVKIGALTAQQGGFYGQRQSKDGTTPNVYSVFTGYSGWQDTYALSSILVDLRSYTRGQAPELTVNPPPFEQSKARLDALLKSIRLRPTEPPMPELANVSAK